MLFGPSDPPPMGGGGLQGLGDYRGGGLLYTGKGSQVSHQACMTLAPWWPMGGGGGGDQVTLSNNQHDPNLMLGAGEGLGWVETGPCAGAGARVWPPFPARPRGCPVPRPSGFDSLQTSLERRAGDTVALCVCGHARRGGPLLSGPAPQLCHMHTCGRRVCVGGCHCLAGG